MQKRFKSISFWLAPSIGQMQSKNGQASPMHGLCSSNELSRIRVVISRIEDRIVRHFSLYPLSTYVQLPLDFFASDNFANS